MSSADKKLFQKTQQNRDIVGHQLIDTIVSISNFYEV